VSDAVTLSMKKMQEILEKFPAKGCIKAVFTSGVL
jgi:hypothetical protein